MYKPVAANVDEYPTRGPRTLQGFFRKYLAKPMRDLLRHPRPVVVSVETTIGIEEGKPTLTLGSIDVKSGTMR